MQDGSEYFVNCVLLGTAEAQHFHTGLQILEILQVVFAWYGTASPLQHTLYSHNRNVKRRRFLTTLK